MNKEECIRYVESHMEIRHATKNGGRTKANDFITKNYEKMENNLEKGIEEVIENGY